MIPDERRAVAEAIGCPLGQRRRLATTGEEVFDGTIVAVAAAGPLPIAVHVETAYSGVVVLNWSHVLSVSKIPSHPALDEDEG